MVGEVGRTDGALQAHAPEPYSTVYFDLAKNVPEGRCLRIKHGDRFDFEVSTHSGQQHQDQSPPCLLLKAIAQLAPKGLERCGDG